MKTGSILLLIALTLTAAADVAKPKPVNLRALYLKGRDALMNHDLVTARRCIEQVLKAEPNFELGKAAMAGIMAAERRVANVPPTLKVAKSSLVNRLELSGATTADALEMARRELEQAGGGPDKLTVNILGVLPDAVRQREITLTAAQVPVDHLLQAIAFAGGLSLAYEAGGFRVFETASGKDPAAEEPSAAAVAKKVVLPRLVMDGATVHEAVQYLQQKAAGSGHTLILALRHGTQGKTVTLDVRNVTLYDALDMIRTLAGLEVRWFPWGAGIGTGLFPVQPGPAEKSPAPAAPAKG